MKKYLYSALALPLLFACSSEDFDEKVISNDQFAGIEKVDATFSMEGITRFDGGVWDSEEGDLWGFAWEGDGTVVPIGTGEAKQNHNLIQTNGIFTPQTSIYIGKYYLYRPYDKTTVSPQAINFKSLEEQPLAEGYASGSGTSAKTAWKDLAKTAINIGDKWTNVTTGGHTIGTDPKIWDKAGIKEHYNIYGAVFSNQTGLDLTYKKNNPTFDAAKRIQGATDIDFTINAGDAVGAADIYDVTVNLAGQAKSFTYAPTVEPNDGVYPQTVGGKTVYHNGEFWATKKNLAAVTAGNPGDGFNFTPGAVKLIAADATNGLSTGDDGSKDWFWFNSLPVTAGDGALGTAVQAVFTSSYGVVTVNSTVEDCASVFEQYTSGTGSPEWIKLADADDNTVSPKTWNLAGTHNTFINQYGNHKGKYALTVNFSNGVMNNMHIKNDTHLQKLLKYYIASGKTETVSLNLDGASAEDKTFKISKNSIALIQSIPGNKVKVHACATHNNPVKIIVTQDGSDGKTEVPELNGVFDASTDVYLASGTNWTWSGDYDGDDEEEFDQALPVDANVHSLTNEGNLTVKAKNIQLTNAAPLYNAAGATMNITKVTTVQNDLTNLGTINVGDDNNTAAELRAYDAVITNNAAGTKANEEFGTINNYGVVGKSAGTTGEVNNYGKIIMKNNDAITLLKTNEKSSGAANAPFGAPYAAGTNMMGTVELPAGNPYALVSVNNDAETGFIKYTLTPDADGNITYRHDNGNVKYNTIVVSNGTKNITFAGGYGSITEVKYIEFEGTRTQVVNPDTSDKLTSLKGVIVNAGKSFILEKTNQLACSKGAFLGAGATVYLGGSFTYPADSEDNNYFGTWTLDQIVEY